MGEVGGESSLLDGAAGVIDVCMRGLGLFSRVVSLSLLLLNTAAAACSQVGIREAAIRLIIASSAAGMFFTTCWFFMRRAAS